MKTLFKPLSLGLVAMALAGCPHPPDPTKPVLIEEDWSFPARPGAEPAVALVAEPETVNVGQTFSLKLVCYNTDGMYGATVHLPYDPSQMRISDILAGPYSGVPHAVVVGTKEDQLGRVSFGSTYTDTTTSSKGSGVLFKVKAQAASAGVAQFVVDPTDIALLDRSGGPIASKAGRAVATLIVR
jgi:hypothetical protein